MAIERSRRRAAWKLGSIAAAVAGSAAVAVVASRRRSRVRTNDAGPRPRPIAPLPSSIAEVPDPGRQALPVPAAPAVCLADKPGAAMPSSIAEVPDPVPVSPPGRAVAAGGMAEPSVAVTGPVTEVVDRPAGEVADRAGPGRRWWVLVGVAGVAIAGLVAGAMVLGGGDGGHEPQAAADVTEPARPTTTDVADLSAAEAFGQAAARLRDAGGFSYAGTSQATDVSPVRPGLWLAVDLTVTGDVDLTSDRLRETGTATDGTAIETVSDGRTVWGRQADATGFLTIGEPSEAPVPRGAALLPTWLDGSVDRQELPADGADGPGDRRFRAEVPAEVLGVVVDGVAPVPAELQLTLDAAGQPTHVELTVTDGPLLHLAFDISRLGAVAPIDVPS